MTVTAAVLLIISAITHAGWNYVSKKEHPTQAFYLVANTIGVICVLPILLYYGDQVHLIPASVWIFAVMSGFLLAAYLQALAGAYRSGDISIDSIRSMDVNTSITLSSSFAPMASQPDKNRPTVRLSVIKQGRNPVQRYATVRRFVVVFMIILHIVQLHT